VHRAMHLFFERSSIRARLIEVSERREMLMRREIVEVADGFTFRGLAQLTSPMHVGPRPSARI